MTRKKVKLAFIANDSSRKATFKKRKKGLLKKVNELATLCGITACAIIYSPYDSNPEVWPSSSGVQRVVTEFRTLPEMDQHKKMVDQETFLRQRIAKATEHLKRQRKENREMEMTEVMFQCIVGHIGMFRLNIMDLNDLGYMIDQYLKDLNRRCEILGNSGMEVGESSNAAAAAGAAADADAASPTPAEETGPLAIATAPVGTIREVGSSSSFPPAAGFFNPIHHHHPFQHLQQQQFLRPPMGPHVGLYDQTRNLNLNLNLNQSQSQSQSQQQWLMEMMNHRPEQMSYAPEPMGFPFMDDSHHHHHRSHHQLLPTPPPPQQQQQQTPGESSTAPPAAGSSSSVNPGAGPNLTNNIWFR